MSGPLATPWVREKVIGVLQQSKDRHIDECRPSATYLMAILANAVTSLEDAEILAPQVEDVIIRTLSQTTDTDLLFVTLGLLEKTLLSKHSEFEYLKAGLLSQLTRLLRLRTTPQIHQESLKIFRLLIYQSLLISASTTSPFHLNEVQTFFSTTLILFTQTPDPSTKTSIARLVIELSRILAHSPSPPSQTFRRLFSTPSSQQAAVSTLFYLAVHAPSDPAKSEAWFGLALLSTWDAEMRHIVLVALEHAEPTLMQEMERIVDEARTGTGIESGGPALANVRLLLAKLTEDGAAGAGWVVHPWLRMLAKRAFAAMPTDGDDVV